MEGAPFTASFVAVCVLLFLASAVSRPAQRAIFLNLSQINAAVGVGQWWRIFTAAFLHASVPHIVFNMWALLLFGPPLERQLGSLTFGTMYFACAAWGGATAYLLADPRVALVGASGAIFGLFGIWLYSSYLSRTTPMGQAQFRSLMILLAINAFLSFAVPHISWQGHVGGLAAGIMIMAVWRRLPPPATPLQRAMVAAVAAGIAIAIVVMNPTAPGRLRLG